MLLAIDVGNTNTVLGLFEGGKLKKTWRVASRKEVLLRLAKRLPKGIDGVVICSVVPFLKRYLHRFARKGCRCLFVNPRLKMPIRIRLKNRSQVGADRIVNVVAAYVKYAKSPQPPFVKGGRGGILIIDLGTATTFDIVTARGEFIGGAITAGIKILSEALYQRCAKLPYVPVDRRGGTTPPLLGRTTVDAIRSGVFWGYVALVDGLIKKVERRYGKCLVIATGGLAGLIARECKEIEKTDPFLTLHGLRILYEWNFKASRRCITESMKEKD